MSIVAYGLFKVVFRKRKYLRSIFCVSKNVDLVCVFSKNALCITRFLDCARNDSNNMFPKRFLLAIDLVL